MVVEAVAIGEIEAALLTENVVLPTTGLVGKSMTKAEAAHRRTRERVVLSRSHHTATLQTEVSLLVEMTWRAEKSKVVLFMEETDGVKRSSLTPPHHCAIGLFAEYGETEAIGVARVKVLLQQLQLLQSTQSLQWESRVHAETIGCSPLSVSLVCAELLERLDRCLALFDTRRLHSHRNGTSHAPCVVGIVDLDERP
jgi:hypothetical protein